MRARSVNLRRLVGFIASVEHGNVTRAARSLGVTPAAVTSGNRRLQEELGLVLVLEAYRHVKITDDGMKLYQGVKSLVDRALSIEGEIMSVIDKLSGSADRE